MVTQCGTSNVTIRDVLVVASSYPGAFAHSLSLLRPKSDSKRQHGEGTSLASSLQTPITNLSLCVESLDKLVTRVSLARRRTLITVSIQFCFGLRSANGGHLVIATCSTVNQGPRRSFAIHFVVNPQEILVTTGELTGFFIGTKECSVMRALKDQLLLNFTPQLSSSPISLQTTPYAQQHLNAIGKSLFSHTCK